MFKMTKIMFPCSSAHIYMYIYIYIYSTGGEGCVGNRGALR